MFGKKNVKNLEDKITILELNSNNLEKENKSFMIRNDYLESSLRFADSQIADLSKDKNDFYKASCYYISQIQLFLNNRITKEELEQTTKEVTNPNLWNKLLVDNGLLTLEEQEEILKKSVDDYMNMDYVTEDKTETLNIKE